MSKRNTILAAVATKLATVSGVTVHRSRASALARSETPAVVVDPIADDANEIATAMMEWSLQMRVAILVRGLVPDEGADPIIEDVHGKIMEDISLGGLSMDIVPSSVKFETYEGDNPIGVVSLFYTIRYRTSFATLN